MNFALQKMFARRLVPLCMIFVYLMSRDSIVQGKHKENPGKGHKPWCSSDVGGACTFYQNCPEGDHIDARCRGRNVCCMVPCTNEGGVCQTGGGATCITNAACTAMSSVTVNPDPGLACCTGLVCCVSQN